MLLAVKNVTQNRGKRTAGIDGVKWTTPNAKMNAALKLSDISPLLANMALDGLEMAIASRWHVSKRGSCENSDRSI